MSTLLIIQKYIKRISREVFNDTFKFMYENYNFEENGTESEEMKEILAKMVESRNSFLESNKKLKRNPIEGIETSYLETKLIYDILKKVYIFFEVDEDLFYDIKDFLEIYKTFYTKDYYEEQYNPLIK